MCKERLLGTKLLILHVFFFLTLMALVILDSKLGTKEYNNTHHTQIVLILPEKYCTRIVIKDLGLCSN